MTDGAPFGQALGQVTARLRAAGCVFAEDEARLLLERVAGREGAEQAAAQLETLVARRVAGEPLEYLVGWAQFGDLRVVVRPGVFVPRARTLVLVREAVRTLRAGCGAADPAADPAPDPAAGPAGGAAGDVVLDLCCGTGAIGAALLHAVPGLQVYAADLDPDAVWCARQNLAAVGADPDRVYQGDLFEPVPDRLRGQVGLLVANAPYVPTAQIAFMPAEAREHEARWALDGGPDGSQVHRRIAQTAASWLRPGGSLLVETGLRQAEAVAGMFASTGLQARVVHDEDLGGTAVVGRLDSGNSLDSRTRSVP